MALATQSITKSFNLVDGKMIQCPKNKGKWITSDMLCYGDYDNSTDIQRANVAYILEHYASNRYHECHYGFGAHQIFLKYTELNSALICDLEDYPVICDSYYYEWQVLHSTEHFYESSISDYPVIHQALHRLHQDTDWTVSQNILQAIKHFSELWCGGEMYHWSGSSYYFTLQNNEYATEQTINEVVLYFINTPPYSKHDLNPDTITESFCDPVSGEYTVVVQNYNNIQLLYGGADYMSSHEYPFQVITIEVGDDVAEIIREAYDEIVEYNYEFLDYSPI
jgi:hypothetical protein